ncbi:imidazole glycerol phosphate synthase subunit HisH [Sphingomonas sp. BN140010]|uniref:Imidazole glycerol phosphate synthase subunit HisH n=1 Tax=Sphingomonas arvum TaxID=2992113 RepID=A0ABT3JBK9_9SPHN|nr:imidazole glycerol phosphate synthase subunit HisH [Sphingomonas sp. BN140010]MCW3796424.1 imidazole glycerol phosphate synthase subunit HisH [Sphingomonas sp. BN140010]
MRLVCIDLGYGNLGSVAIAFERLGVVPEISGEPEVLRAADKLVLPGVGHAGYAMRQARARGLDRLVAELPQPLLGICLGMQLLFEHTEEEDTRGLGLLPGRVRKLQPAPERPVPHMGWSKLDVRDPSLGLASGDYVYFAHSYACDDGPATAASTDYGRTVPAVVRSGRLTGAQFHPERSGAAGARFLGAWLAA